MPIATPQGTLDFKSVDKVTFVGASSNTVIDTTTGSLGVGVGVGGPTSNLHVVGHTRLEGDIDMLHTANTASIKLNSNVVTEFPRSKKLIKYPRVVLTANGLNQGYTVSGSDDYSSGLTFYGAFTPPTTLSTPSGAWLAPTSGTTGYSTSTGEYLLSAQLHSGSLTGEYVQIVLPERINPVYFTVQPRPESANNNQGLLSCIKEGEIWASNDSGTTWTAMGTIQNFTPTGLYQEYVVDNFNVSGYYDTFALIIHKNNGQVFAGVGEWKIFGVPEYDPDAAGVDMKVTSYPNVPNTDWLDIYYDGQDYTSMPTTVDNKTGVSTYDATPINGVGFDATQKAFTFDANSSQYLSSSTPVSGNYIHTISMWFKGTNLTSTGGDTLMWIGDNTDNKRIEIYIENDLINYNFRTNNVEANTKLENNRWYHLTCTYNGTQGLAGREIYVDGQRLFTTHSGNLADLNITNSTLNVGGYSGTTTTYMFSGSIANFRFSNRVLTPDEVWQLYSYQKEYFGHGDMGMTLKAGRLGIGTSEPRAALDVMGRLYGPGTIPCFTIHTGDYWGVDYSSWGTTTGTNWNVVYRTPLPFIQRTWLEYDTHNVISFVDYPTTTNTGTKTIFTAPMSGFYHFSFNIGFKTNSGNDYVAFMLTKNDTEPYNGPNSGVNDYLLGVAQQIDLGMSYHIGSSVNIFLKKGETVVPYSRSVNSLYVSNGGGFNFSGYFIG